MKIKTLTILLIAMTWGNFILHSQSIAPIDFDIRGRDCFGGVGICSVMKSDNPSKNFLILKVNKNTFMLSIPRISLSIVEEEGIAGQPFSEIQIKPSHSFVQNGDFYFSDEVLETLGIDSKYKLLREGVYPMRIDKDFVKITLTLTEVSKN